MKYLFHFICFAILFTACSDKEEVITGDCIGIIDFIGPPRFELKFIDDDETNLIESGYYDSALISSSINGQPFNGKIIDQGFQNIVLFPGLGQEGENRWILTLSESEIDTLDFSLVFTEVKEALNGEIFCGTNASVETLSYNGNPIDLEASYNEDSYNYSISITKTTE